MVVADLEVVVMLTFEDVAALEIVVMVLLEIACYFSAAPPLTTLGAEGVVVDFFGSWETC